MAWNDNHDVQIIEYYINFALESEKYTNDPIAKHVIPVPVPGSSSESSTHKSTDSS